MTSGSTFLQRWVLANVAGFGLGYAVYTPIAHGVTGSHSFELTSGQLVAHCVALVVVASSVGGFQRWALRDTMTVSKTRVAAAALCFVAAFWIGYYTPFDGPDLDMVFGFLVLGAATWPRPSFFAKNPIASTAAVLAFPLMGILAEVVLFAAAIAIGTLPDLQGNPVYHALFWLYLGLSAAIGGGFVSAKLLDRILDADLD